MKKVIIVSSVVMSLLVSCKKEKSEEMVPAEAETSEIKKPVSECYVAVLKKDTISMTLDLDKNQVAGELSYKFFEKDSNSGILAGEMKGDTLIADYTFNSEGRTSIRQVAFLRKGNAYIEGYGDIIQDSGKVRFKNPKQLNFDGKVVLSKRECKL